MVAKKGDIITMTNGQKFLIDDIKIVDSKEYAVMYSIDDYSFVIGTETIDNGKEIYELLNKADAVKIAEKIDSMK